MDIKKGDKIIIDGKVHYGQDFQFGADEFKDIVWTVETFINGRTRVSLSAPGYGELKGEYGNGRIFVSKKYFKHFKKATKKDKDRQVLAVKDRRIAKLEERNKNLKSKVTSLEKKFWDIKGILKS
jgi:hypothetical protein